MNKNKKAIPKKILYKILNDRLERKKEVAKLKKQN